MLDTNAWLWMVGASSNLGAKTKLLLGEAQHELTLSVTSAREVGIKSEVGKLTVADGTEDFIRWRVWLPRITPLTITLEAFAGHRAPADLMT
jgi:PIN domain nuclease of toxin-antitoxin system